MYCDKKNKLKIMKAIKLYFLKFIHFFTHIYGKPYFDTKLDGTYRSCKICNKRQGACYTGGFRDVDY